jgi:hypothetical protein
MTVHLLYAYLLLLLPSASDVFAKVVRIHVFITFIVADGKFSRPHKFLRSAYRNQSLGLLGIISQPLNFSAFSASSPELCWQFLRGFFENFFYSS